MIDRDWSPEKISGHLKLNGEPSISPQWLYRHIYADKRDDGTLYTHLRCQKKRRKRYGSTERCGQIIVPVCITERLELVESRSRIGGRNRIRDWEADKVIGKQGGAVLVPIIQRNAG